MPAPSLPPARNLGPLAVVIAALTWSTNGLATSLLPIGTAPSTIAATRMLGGGLLLLLLCRTDRLRFLFTSHVPRWPIAVAACAMAVYQIGYFTAMEQAGVAVGSVVTMGSVPVFAGLIGLAGRGGLSRRWIAATPAAIIGVALLAFTGSGQRPVAGGVCWALAAGASYAVFTLASGTLIQRGAEPRTTMAAVFLAAGLMLLPILVTQPYGWIVTGPGMVVLGYLLTISTVGAYLLFGFGLRTTAATTVSTLTLAEAAGAAVVGLLFLHEPLSGTRCAGLLLLVLALLMLTLPARHRRLALPRVLRSRIEAG